MTEKYILIIGITELLTFITVMYLIIRANIVVNELQSEVNELHLCLPGMLRDIRTDLKDFNADLAEQFPNNEISSQKIGTVVGKICTEIIIYRINPIKFGKKFIFLSRLLKTLNIDKLLKLHSLLKN